MGGCFLAFESDCHPRAQHNGSFHSGVLVIQSLLSLYTKLEPSQHLIGPLKRFHNTLFLRNRSQDHKAAITTFSLLPYCQSNLGFVAFHFKTIAKLFLVLPALTSTFLKLSVRLPNVKFVALHK
jgi:hypothetical protein